MLQANHGAVVGIVGLGYVGLPTALAYLAAGSEVVGLDVSEQRLDDIRSGRADLLPSDRARLAAHLDGAAFELTSDPARLSRADTILICVPTPVDQHLVPELSALAGACAMVAAAMVPGQAVVLTSTTYAGTTQDLLAEPLTARGLVVGRDVFVAFSSERIDPGNSDHLQETTPRVLGGVTPECARRIEPVLAKVSPSVHVVSSPAAAEMSKLLENTFRAVNIAFVNEIAEACRGLGLSPMEVIDAASTKPFGFMRFTPGPGVGGHCIPCDPHYLTWQMRSERIAMPLVESAMIGIAQRPGHTVRRIGEVLAEDSRGLRGARVLVVGAAYKPGVADVRESPALEIIVQLAEAGADVAYTDALVPVLTAAGRQIKSARDPYTQDWDLIVVHTLHPGTDTEWLRGRRVLDTTYRLPASTGLVTL